MCFHPAVPEFCYNSAESKLFVDSMGTLRAKADFLVKKLNDQGGLNGAATEGVDLRLQTEIDQDLKSTQMISKMRHTVIDQEMVTLY